MGQRKTKRTIPDRKPPLPWLLLGLAGIALVALAAWLAWRGQAGSVFTPRVSGAPRLQVDREEIDFGDVRLGTPVRAEFKLTNVGSETLRLTEAPYVELKEGC
jgi:hypothetical protein